MLWEKDMCQLLQIMHAEGVSNGNRYVWRKFYEAPEIDAIIQQESNSIDWKDLDP